MQPFVCEADKALITKAVNQYVETEGAISVAQELGQRGSGAIPPEMWAGKVNKEGWVA